MFHYITVKKTKPDWDAELVGMLGVEAKTGLIAAIGKSLLIGALNALLDRDHTFSYQHRSDDGRTVVQDTVSSSQDPVRWLNEARRQVPAPYWGMKVQDHMGLLDAGLHDLWSAAGQSTAAEFKFYI